MLTALLWIAGVTLYLACGFAVLTLGVRTLGPLRDDQLSLMFGMWVVWPILFMCVVCHCADPVFSRLSAMLERFGQILRRLINRLGGKPCDGD